MRRLPYRSCAHVNEIGLGAWALSCVTHSPAAPPLPCFCSTCDVGASEYGIALSRIVFESSSLDNACAMQWMPNYIVSNTEDRMHYQGWCPRIISLPFPPIETNYSYLSFRKKLQRKKKKEKERKKEKTKQNRIIWNLNRARKKFGKNISLSTDEGTQIKLYMF